MRLADYNFLLVGGSDPFLMNSYPCLTNNVFEIQNARVIKNYVLRGIKARKIGFSSGIYGSKSLAKYLIC